MNFKKLLLGSAFIIMSGVIYEIDKALNYYKWASYVIAVKGLGGYNQYPDNVYLNDNFFVLLFLIIGFAFYINGGIGNLRQKTSNH